MIQRTFIPGSQWLYFKIYTGTKTADEILLRHVYPYVQNLWRDHKIDNYFFIRYTDPEFHIRLRVHIPDSRDYSTIFQKFLQYVSPEIETGNIIRIMCDTYVREVERYGDTTIEHIENLFRIDSETVLELLCRLKEKPAEEQETLRWQMALLILDDTLTAFNYDLNGKALVLSRMSESFKQEFRFTSHAYTKQLNDKYRRESESINQLFAQRQDIYFAKLLENRKTQYGRVAQDIDHVIALNSKMKANRDDLLFSIQHMTMNRWFRSHNRLHELVIYDFLRKHYESQKAKLRFK